jgi:hypothetical protein
MNVYLAKNITREDIPAILSGDNFLVITLKEIHPKLEEVLTAHNIESVGSCPEEAFNDIKDILSMSDFDSPQEIADMCRKTIRSVKAVTLRD